MSSSAAAAPAGLPALVAGSPFLAGLPGVAEEAARWEVELPRVRR